MAATDEEIIEWATRHDIQRGVSTLTDLRCAFEDAQTLIQPPQQGWKLVPNGPTDMSAKPLSKAESKWLAAVEKLMMACPSKRLGAYTIGDAQLIIYDKEVSDAWVAENSRRDDVLDAHEQHRRAGSHLVSIKTAFQIDSCAG